MSKVVPIGAAAPAPLAALVVAHPGHEPRVHGWLEATRPRVFILTDGSGHTGQGRLASTTEVLRRAGARPGSIYGRLADRRLYRALLDREIDLFAALAEELAEALEREEIEVAVGDAVEGFNPGHDVCRLLLNAAVARVAASGRAIRNYEFPLEAAPDSEAPASGPHGSLRLDLDAAALARKLAASSGYPEMAYEVEKALAAHGAAAFQTEVLRPVDYSFDIAGRFAHPPYYETYGEQQVAKGIYAEVLRFRDHFEPLALESPAAMRSTPGLRVLFTNTMLDPRAGSELYLLDLARRLKRGGYTLAAFSTRLGEVAEARREGVEVVDRLGALSAPPELIHGQHHLETMMALLHFPGVPALFVCHGAVPWEEMPPCFPRIHRYVAVDDPTRERLRATVGIEEERIVQILNFVDLERFLPRSPLPPRPRRALAFSNRASEASFLPLLREACLRHGIALDVAGLDSGHSTPNPEAILPAYDLVFAKARSALEALAVGCAVVLCDASGLGPLVTPENYDRLRPLNFGFRTLDRPHDPDLVAGEIERFDPDAARRVSERVRTEAGIESAVARYQLLYAEIVAEARGSEPAGADTERQATVAYLRRVRETYPPRRAVEADLAYLRTELEILRGSLAFRARQKILDWPLLRRIFLRLRRG